MATEAMVTIKVTTSEWELIRNSLEFSKDTCLQTLKDANLEVAKRAANREMAGRYTDLLRRLAG